jgi:transcription-repair coupling factor (superfamily II helicase)
LLCGDVGYGKTEVAIRAAFKAILDGKQIAVLVPTTVLAQQHYNTFRERMADYPVKIRLLSRYRTRKQQQKTIDGLKNGSVDLVIGTHRLIQKDVKFKELGLVIIDEEQRFGVRHKERLKKLRKEVDVLTMTATPIPRTLQFSLMGLRDMSLIDTAPKGRIPIQTEVVRFDEEIIANAILREVDRGGQVYFLHNRVQTIDAMAGFIKRTVPQVRVGVAHGQMGGHRLEKAMLDFLDHRYDVLVCTTIIESGIDIPNVNTIIINRADRFGLAQLYQLRGRVGRSHRRAYAYLLTPKKKTLTKVARRRLQAIEEFTALGSGFKIALRDLEIRGAGNMLGAEQSGYVNAVGFDLYTQLLKEAVLEIKGETPKKRIDPKMTIAIDAYLPDNYIPDARQKVMIYKNLAELEKFEETQGMYEELKDRYGEIPVEAKALLDTIGLRLLGAEMNVGQITIKGGEIFIEFRLGQEPDPRKIAQMTDVINKPFEFVSGNQLALSINYEGLENIEILRLAHKALLALRD